MAKPDATELLFGHYRRKVLALLMAQPDEAFHVREIARQTDVPVGSLHRELRALADAGILLRTPVENQVRYRANRRCPIFQPLAAIFGPTPYPANDSTPALRAAEPEAAYGVLPPEPARVLDRLNVSLRQVAAFARRHRLRKLSFFGSVTRADFRPDSDVDVLVEFVPGERRRPFDIVDMRDELSAMFGGRDVDVVTRGVFRNPLRRESIEQDLTPVYDAA